MITLSTLHAIIYVMIGFMVLMFLILGFILVARAHWYFIGRFKHLDADKNFQEKYDIAPDIR
jgi:hypothetical protein